MRQSRKERVAFWVDCETAAQFRELSEKTNVPMSRMFAKGLQMAIDYYQEREELIQKALEEAELV
jgi:DNA replication protein DnaD